MKERHDIMSVQGIPAFTLEQDEIERCTGEDNVVTYHPASGVSHEQIRWGSHQDPFGLLVVDQQYIVDRIEVHTWHTKVFLVGFEGSFNSVWFKEL